jgi:dephospho-CoA kinase
VKAALVARWGDRVVGSAGGIDRGRVGEIVFSDRRELEWLESLLHPRVAAEQARWRDEQRAPIVAIEVPLLYETGAEERFDAVVVVTAPAEVRAARSAVADAAKRADRLIPDEEKMRRADFAYVNDGSLEELDAFVADVMARLIETG